MGNRAVIAFTAFTDPPIGIYLHWNGGRESVQAFLDATRTLTASRGPDAQYRRARLIQVIGNFLGGSLSLGLDLVTNLDTDNGDNGIYYVDPATLEIKSRSHAEDRDFDQARYKRVLAEVIEKNQEPFARGQ